MCEACEQLKQMPLPDIPPEQEIELSSREYQLYRHHQALLNGSTTQEFRDETLGGIAVRKLREVHGIPIPPKVEVHMMHDEEFIEGHMTEHHTKKHPHHSDHPTGTVDLSLPPPSKTDESKTDAQKQLRTSDT